MKNLIFSEYALFKTEQLAFLCIFLEWMETIIETLFKNLENVKLLSDTNTLL